MLPGMTKIANRYKYEREFDSVLCNQYYCSVIFFFFLTEMRTDAVGKAFLALQSSFADMDHFQFPQDLTSEYFKEEGGSYSSGKIFKHRVTCTKK